MPLYKITFTDNTTFLGGDTIEDSKWDKIPDKDILCLEYFLCNGTSLVLRDFESYAAYSEVLAPLMKKLGNCPKCNALGKISQIITQNKENKQCKRVIIQCKNTKCDWQGNIRDLKEKIKAGKWKYIMGVKKGVVTSFRITLNGDNGKDKYQSGDITKRQYPEGKECKGKPIPKFVWKRGIK